MLEPAPGGVHVLVQEQLDGDSVVGGDEGAGGGVDAAGRLGGAVGPQEPVGDGFAQPGPVVEQGLGDGRVAGGVDQEVGLHQQPVHVEQQHLGDPVDGGGHVERGALLGEGVGDLARDEVGALLVEGEEQLVQGGEVGVEGAAAVTGGLADLLDGDPAEPLGGEHREGGGEQIGPRLRPPPGDPRCPALGRHRPHLRFDTGMYPIHRCIERGVQIAGGAQAH